MELGFIESLRRRWGVLGINADGKGKGRGDEDNEVENTEGAASRRDIMEGAIVKSVIRNAVQGGVDLFDKWKIYGQLNFYSTPENRTLRNVESGDCGIPLSGQLAGRVAGIIIRTS